MATLHEEHEHLAHDEHPSPFARFIALIRRERSDMFVLLTYTIVVFMLSLLVPLTTQSLVNNIAMGIQPTQIVILALLLFLGLGLAGGMQLLQLALVESVQQRIFATTALRISDTLARVSAFALRKEYAPELVNRFFDVLTVQKTLSKLTVDGLTAIVQITLGLVLLGFYNPTLLLIDFLLLTGLISATILMGWGGLRTSLKESKAKYAVADWLEDIARCHISLKVHGFRDFLQKQADLRISEYVKNRRKHFKVTIRQVGTFYAFQAIVQAGALAGGGFQVLSGNLTLGQLVAAQIIIAQVLASMEKLTRQADLFFDLLTGLDKVGHVTDLQTERTGGGILPYPTEPSGAEVVCRSVRFSYLPEIPILTGLSMHLPAGARVSLVGASGAGKSTLGALLCGLEKTTHGTVEIDGAELSTLCLDSIRRHISMIGYDNELFDGTIEQNIVVGRQFLTPQDVRWALDMAQLSDDIALMENGLSTHVISGGKNLSRGQIQRILIARAIVAHPRLLILDEAFTGIDERSTMKILDAIFDQSNHWTIIDISHDAAVIQRTDIVYVLADGQILETGLLHELAGDPSGEFSLLFPVLSKTLRERVS